jgi:hypothetical protein
MYDQQMKLLAATIGYLFGAFAMIFGEADDSPGLQGIGLLTILFITYKLITAYKKKKL